MNLSELFIRRPVTTVLLNAAIVLAGVIAYGRIPVAAPQGAASQVRFSP